MQDVRNGAAQASATSLGAGRLDKDEALAATVEMPEMLYKLCLVARELELSYAACGNGVRIGSPCLVRLLHDALFLEAVVMRCTPREENFELVRQPRLRTPWPESSAGAQERTLGCKSLPFAVFCRGIFKHTEAALGTANWTWSARAF